MTMYDDDLDDLPPMAPQHIAALHHTIDVAVERTLENLWEVAGVLETGIDPRIHFTSINLIITALKDVVEASGMTGPVDWDAALKDLL